MLQKAILNNPSLQSLIAKWWKVFKQKNPVIALIIFITCMVIVNLPSIAPDYGLDLPKWFSVVVTLISSFWLGLNGSDTHEYLEKDTEPV